MSPVRPDLRVALLVGWYYPDSAGGTEAYVRWLARDLRERGCHVVIGAPGSDGIERRYEIDGVPVFRYPVDLEPATAEVSGAVPPARFEVFARWLEREQPDVVHVHSFTRGCGVFHARHAKAMGVPVVITAHVPGFVCPRGTMMRWGATPCDGHLRARRCAACWLHARGVPRAVAWPMALLPERLARGVNGPAGAGARGGNVGRAASALAAAGLMAARHDRARGLFHLADRVVAVSEWLSRALALNGVDPHKLALIRHGLPPHYPRAATTARPRPSGPLRVGYVGRMTPVKGLDVLIRAARAIEPAVPLALHVYGRARDPEEERYLSAIRAAAGNDRRIAFHGELTDAQRHDAFAGLDVLAVPSLWLESGPLVVLEAFAAGVPVLGSDAGGIAELVTDGVSGRLVPPGRVGEWSRALRELCEQSAAGRWRWRMPPVPSSEHVADRMLEMYSAVRGPVGAAH